MGKLNGKVAIVTGAGEGAGYGSSIVMAREGAAIVLMGRTASKLEKVAREIGEAGGRSLVVPGDVTRPEDIDRVIAATMAKFGRIDILVTAAQSPAIRSSQLLTIPDAEIDTLWQSGALATLRFMRGVHPYMKAQGGGSIITYGSGGIHFPGGYGVYSAVKAAIQTMTRAAALEWAGDRIRVNVVLPMVNSPAADEQWALDPGSEVTMAKMIPLGWIGDPVDDIGPPVAFLASEESRYITGHTFALDGGIAYLR